MIININGYECKTLNDIKLHSSPLFFEFVQEYLNDSQYIIAHSSGSTGAPKQIKLLKADMRVSAQNTCIYFELSSDSVLYLCLSPKYIAGKMMIVRALELKCSIIEEAPSNDLLQNYNGQKIDFAALVPSQLPMLLRYADRLGHISNMIIGGAQIPDVTKRRICELGISAYETYGMTETCSHVALRKITKDNLPFEMVGDNEACLSDNGCLTINLPDYSLTSIQTNDIIDIVDKKHFYWKGRFDNVINSGGIKVFPETIEPIISKLLPNIKFFISSIPSDKWGEEVALIIEYPGLKNGEKRIGKINQILLEKLKSELPPYSVPHKYVAIKQFQYTSNGKLIREY